MTFDIQTWLATFHQARCAPKSFKITERSLVSLKSEGVPSADLGRLQRIKGLEVEGETRIVELLKITIGDVSTNRFKPLILKHAAIVSDLARQVLERDYPLLLNAGYELLPNIAIDMAHLYQRGESARFEAPSDLLQPYCERLNAADGEGHLHRAIKRAHVLRLLRHDHNGDASAPLPGLFSFLQLAASFFPAVGDDDLWRQVRQSWNSATIEAALSSGARNPDAEKLLMAFFKSFNDRERQPANGKWQSASEAEGLLTLAAARVPMAIEGLDLPLLQACLDYRPLELDDPGTNRLPVGAISPRENRRSRSPELGNHGIDRQGSLTAILRSLLARDDFIERYHRNELLYFKRHAPKLEPRRILLAWVIERSDPMCARADGNRMRRDTAALRLAALTLEDAVRHLAWFPVLDLHVAVLLHNGEKGEKLRGALLEPKMDELLTAPRADSQKQEIWLPRLAAFMPHYFLREPIWPKENPFDKTSSGHNEPGAASGIPPFQERLPDETLLDHSTWGRALKVLCRFALRSEIDSFGDSAMVFDLAHVALLGRGEELPTTGKVRSQMLHMLTSISGQSSLHGFAFDETHTHWTPWPPLREKTLKPTADGYGYEAESLKQLRQGYWNDLARRLLML